MRPLLLASLLFMAPDDADWKVGVAEVKITPAEPIPMAGYAARTKPFAGVTQDLWARALALEDARGNRAVLVTSDLIGFRAAVAEEICRRVGEKNNFRRDQVLLNSSHTHAGPQTSLEAAAGGEEARRVVAYTNSLVEKVVELIARSLSRLEPARLDRGTGVAGFVMNRREFTPTGIVLGVNPRGPVDRSVPVLRVTAPDGKLRAVLFGAACHNTTLGGDNLEICGDYAGWAQTEVQERHPGVPALFMLGCGGDANPWPRGTMDHARGHGGALGREVCRVLDTKLAPVRGPLATAFERVALPLLPPAPPEELRQIVAKGPSYRQPVARQILAALERGEKPATHYAAPLAVWQFGEDLTLVGFPGETVVDFVALTERAIGPLRLWIAGYCNDVFGYLPSARVVEEGGYETRGAYYGSAGFFSPAAQDALIVKVRELAEKVGRKGIK